VVLQSPALEVVVDRLTYRVHLEETVDLVVEVDMGSQEMLLEQLVDLEFLDKEMMVVTELHITLHHMAELVAAVLVLLVVLGLILVEMLPDLVVMDYRLHGTKQLHYLDIMQVVELAGVQLEFLVDKVEVLHQIHQEQVMQLPIQVEEVLVVLIQTLQHTPQVEVA
jgi:CheY-like chemotaxis protein